MERFRPDAAVGAVVMGVIDQGAVESAANAVELPIRLPRAAVDKGARQPQYEERAEPSCVVHEVASSDALRYGARGRKLAACGHEQCGYPASVYASVAVPH